MLKNDCFFYGKSLYHFILKLPLFILILIKTSE